MKKILIAYLVWGIMIPATSCRILKPYHSPGVDTKGLYRDPPSTDTTTMAALHWTEIFNDSLLQNLIEEGISNNLDLKIAYSRVEQAQAYFQQSKLAFFPTINSDATAQFGKTSNSKTKTSGNNNVYQLSVNASWEVDLWGKIRSSKRANLASLLQSEAYTRAVQTGVVAGIANYYYALLALDQQLSITEQSVKNWMTTVDMMKALKDANVVTGAAVVQSEASRYAVEVTIPDLKQAIRQAENAMSILLGRAPGPINRNTFFEQKITSLLNTGVPAQLLAYRPDVQEAEFNYRYNFELTNVARTYFYPSLIISASGGFNSSSISSLFNPPALIGSVAGGLMQPLFNQGINRARLKVSLAAQQQAVLAFQNILLVAGQEVSDDLAAYQSTLQKANLRDSQIVNLQKSVEYTQQLVRYSSANYTEVLTAQQSLFSSQLSQVNDRLQQLQAVVYLYRDLGGGWK